MSRENQDPMPIRFLEQLPEPAVSDHDIEEMQRSVLELVRLQERGLLAEEEPCLAQSHSSEGHFFQSRRQLSLPAAIALAACVLAAVLVPLAFIGSAPNGLEQDAGLAEANSNSLGVVQIDSSFEDAVALLPLVEELDASPSREVYQMSAAALDIVMVFDDQLDF